MATEKYDYYHVVKDDIKEAIAEATEGILEEWLDYIDDGSRDELTESLIEYLWNTDVTGSLDGAYKGAMWYADAFKNWMDNTELFAEAINELDYDEVFFKVFKDENYDLFYCSCWADVFIRGYVMEQIVYEDLDSIIDMINAQR